jgi:hypothetical protein
LTHWIPLGEKMENPEEEPARISQVRSRRISG